MASGNPKISPPEISRPAPFRRAVFYLAGFDPRGARFYHQLLDEEITRANTAANATGSTPLTLSPRRRDGTNAAWTVDSKEEEAGESEGGAVHAEHVFLVWDDIVRAHWPQGLPAVFGGALTAYRGFCTRMNRHLLRQAPRGSLIALYYPGLTLFALPVLAMLILWLALGLVLPFWGAIPLAAVGGWFSAWLILKRIHSLWLLRFVMFNDRLARGAPGPALADRLDDFASRIATALQEDWDEVLFVTHSNGSILSVPVMVRLLEQHGGTLPEHFSLVTLGGCIPLLACRRDAGWFHTLLDRLANHHIRWLDIGSLTDGACTPLMPPCLGRAVERPAGLVQLSPRWFRYADPATYQARRSNKYETHFEYLRRLDRPSPLDYIGITCSGRALAASIDAFLTENGLAEHSP